MKKVVVLMEKFCDLNPALGTTSAYSNVVGSLISSEIADIKIYHYDEYLFSTGKSIDGFLVNELILNKPDFLVVSYYPFVDPRNVRLETFGRIKELGIPVIFIWFDFGHAQIRHLAEIVTPHGTLSVVVDTCNVPQGQFMPMWVPQDENIFKPGTTKDIDLSFVGTTNGYNTRCHYINFLKQYKPIHISGGQREHRLTIEQYAETLQRSKLTLNFPDKPDGIIQAKCRVYESMLCGTLLLEKENTATQRWFTPMEDYIPFKDEQDLLDKINYYLTHEEKREIIINNALSKMRSAYSSKNWWLRVFEGAK